MKLQITVLPRRLYLGDLSTLSCASLKREQRNNGLGDAHAWRHTIYVGMMLPGWC